MTADLVCDVLKMALFRRGFPKSVIVHGNRGSQYCSHDYRDLIKKHQLVQRGNCWDNACAESFFHSLKVEAIQDEPIMVRETMRQHVFEYRVGMPLLKGRNFFNHSILLSPYTSISCQPSHPDVTALIIRKSTSTRLWCWLIVERLSFTSSKWENKDIRNIK